MYAVHNYFILDTETLPNTLYVDLDMYVPYKPMLRNLGTHPCQILPEVGTGQKKKKAGDCLTLVY